jgi:hypothetical protein
LTIKLCPAWVSKCVASAHCASVYQPPSWLSFRECTWLSFREGTCAPVGIAGEVRFLNGSDWRLRPLDRSASGVLKEPLHFLSTSQRKKLKINLFFGGDILDLFRLLIHNVSPLQKS